MTASPKTIPAATRMLERYADLQARLALVEEDRTSAIAAANMRADVASAPMLEEAAKLVTALQPWWANAGAEIASGRKSAELGGCMIGTRLSRAKLAHGFDSDDKAVEALLGTRYAKYTTKVRHSLDRTATLKLLQIGGRTAAGVASLGFRIDPGTEEFFVQRAEQPGTRQS